jgi:uncharacterized membrane protein
MIVARALTLMAHMSWGMDWDHGGWFWMILMMVGGAILLVAVVYLLMRPFYGPAPTRQGPGQHESAMDVAKRRYASGEITSEEFEKIKRDLGG